MNLGELLSVIISLLILEVLLSVDNALVNISIARRLPRDQQPSAVRRGIFLAAGFRVVMLLAASLIIHNVWLRTLGAIYLIFLTLGHFGRAAKAGEPIIRPTSYRGVVTKIALTDMVFSIDNVVSAIGLTSNITYVIVGVLIGVFSIVILSSYMLKLVDRFPQLATAGYLIVGFIGCLMLYEQLSHNEIVVFYKLTAIVIITIATIFYGKPSKSKQHSL